MCNAFNQVLKTLLIAFYSIFFAIAVTACGGGGGDNTPVGGLDCSVENPDAACDEDLDGDGMSYKMETDGWEVWPDRFGLGQGTDTFGQMDAHYLVTSNPDVVDTDGDGLSDFDEFLNKTDPTMADTDGDGLTDSEELNRWGTSPLSVDSDGDSRGPDKDLAPSSLLFDSAELKIDLLGDPTHTPGFAATSPTTDDTDGDGWSDYYEILDSSGAGFNPVFADIPSIKIEIAASPVIRLIGEHESGAGWERNVSVTNSLAESVSSESSVTSATELVVEHTVGGGLEFGFEVGSEGGKLTGSASANYSFAQATGSSHSVAWTEGQSRAAETAYQESETATRSESVTLTGGTISVPVNIVNTGNVSFTLTGLRLNLLARYINGTSDFTPAKELARADDLPLTLAPGQRFPNILMQVDTSDYKLIQDLLKNPSGLMLDISSYTLTDKDGVSYAFAEENIKQKTAMIVIDYGGELPPETYLMSTVPQRDSALESGVTMAAALNDIIGIPYETVMETTDTGLFMSLSKVKTIANDATLHKVWLVSTTSASLDDPNLSGFDDIVLKAGDAAYFMFVQDQDGDGLSAREEFLQGLSDQTADSDGDGLTDFEETREGWSVKIEGQLAYDVLSRGYNADSDGDELDDAFERSCGLDPILVDTDQDGISDYDEIYGYQILDGDQNLFLNVIPYVGEVILDGGNATIDTLTPSGDDQLVAVAPINNGAIIITSGADGVLDTTPMGDDYAGVNHIALACESDGFATNPLDINTDKDNATDKTEYNDALGSPNNPGDSAVYADSDGDGLSDALETSGFSSSVNGQSQTFYSNHALGYEDTDSDGLPDLLEYMLRSNPEASDTDGDGLSDFDEYSFSGDIWDDFITACTLSCVIPTSDDSLKHGTELNHEDSDGDGLGDNLEINGWNIMVNAGQPRLVKTNALANEDTDNDTLFDFDEHKNGSDPELWDTDADGSSDGAEVAADPASGGERRNPIYWDRKITIRYDSIGFYGECDGNDYIDIEYVLGIRAPGLPTDFEAPERGITRYYSSGLDAADPLNVGPVTSTTFPDYQKNYGGAMSFIARKTDYYELLGYVKEMDKHKYGFMDLLLSGWENSDGGMFFYDADCGEYCKDLFIKDINDELGNMVHVTSETLKFRADTLPISSEPHKIVIQASQSCWAIDDGAHISFVFIAQPIPFTVMVEATVMVE